MRNDKFGSNASMTGDEMIVFSDGRGIPLSSAISMYK